MKRIVIGITLSLACCVPIKAQTERVDRVEQAGYLAEHCQSAEAAEDWRLADCVGRIHGMRNVIDRYHVLLSDSTRRATNKVVEISIDKTARSGQLIRVFTAYVKMHPELENKYAVDVFLYALIEAKLLEQVPIPPTSSSN